MAMSFVQSFSGTASNTTLSAALSNIAVGDVVVVWCGSGKKSDGIPNTAGEAPSFSTSTSGTPANDFTLVAQQNSADARISCYIKEYNSALLPKSVHMGSGWSGNGNHYVIHVVRDVDTGTSPFYVAASPSGPSQTNSPFPITEAVPSSGWPSGRTFTYLSGWSVEANCNFSSAQPAGSVVLSSMQSSGNRGALGTAHLTDTSLTSPNISIIGSLSGDEVSSINIVLVSTSSGTDHPSNESDTSEASDSLGTTKSAVFTEQDTSNASDALSAVKSTSFADTDTSEASDSLSAIKSATSLSTDTSETSDTLSAIKTTTKSNTDTSEASDSLSAVAAKTSGSTDTSSAEDSLSAQKAAVFSETDTSEVSDVLSATKETTESNTDTSSASDTLDTLVSKSFVKTDTSEINDTLSATKSATESNTDTSSVSDALSAQKSVVFSKTDTSEAQDTLSAIKESTEQQTDTSETLDTVSATKSVVLSITDTASASDDKSAAVTANVNHPSNEEDTSSASDTVSLTKEAQSSNTDSTEVSDTLSVEKAVFSEEQDASEASDSLSATVQHLASITDSASSSDALSAPAQKEVSITDTSESGDTKLTIRTITVNLVDTAEGSDLAGSQTDREIILLDTASVSDELSAVGPETREITATIVGNGGIDPNLMTEVQALATIDIWNVALNALGISTLEDTGTVNPQQTLLSNTFPLFRKQFLSDHLWNGAKRTADLTALSIDTTNNAVANRWGYAYELPSLTNSHGLDCLRVFRLNGSENKPNHTGGNPAILTNRWEIEVVTVSGVHYRALCTEESTARIEYVFDVGNNIDLLGPLTQHAMGLSLAAFVATNFGKSASEIAQLEAQAKEAVTAAKGVDGQEGTPQMFGDTSLLRVRSLGN